jgi:hypothetical protein
MSKSDYPIPTREVIHYIATDGEEFESEVRARQHNAKLAIRKIVDEHGGFDATTADEVAMFIIMQASALGPWFDDLMGG